MHRDVTQRSIFWKLQHCWSVKYKKVGSREAELEIEVRSKALCAQKGHSPAPEVLWLQPLKQGQDARLRAPLSQIKVSWAHPLGPGKPSLENHPPHPSWGLWVPKEVGPRRCIMESKGSSLCGAPPTVPGT